MESIIIVLAAPEEILKSAAGDRAKVADAKAFYEHLPNILGENYKTTMLGRNVFLLNLPSMLHLSVDILAAAKDHSIPYRTALLKEAPVWTDSPPFEDR